MILIDTKTKIRYDTEKLEARVAGAIKQLRDERVVKPRQFKISDIDPEGNRNGIFVHSDDEVKRVEECRARILWGTIKYAEGCKAGYDAIFKSVIPIQSELVHQSKIFGIEQIDLTSTFIQNRVIGDPKSEVFGRLRKVRGNPTYLKEKGVDVRDYMGGANKFFIDLDGKLSKTLAYWQFNISVSELLKTRTTFFDPEGTYSPHEYKKGYLVFGGIPIQAITSANVQIRPYDKL